MVITCCKDCEERHPKCHADCERYLAQREEMRKEAEKRLAERRVEDAMIETQLNIKDRWRRGHK